MTQSLGNVLAESITAPTTGSERAESSPRWWNSPIPERPLWKDVLHIFAVFNFAVAYPILDHMGYDAWFYVVERAQPLDIVLLTFALSLLVPLIAAIVRVAVQAISVKAGNLAHGFLIVAFLIAGTVHTLTRRSHPDDLMLIWSLGVLICFVLTLAYLRFAPAQSFASILAISIVLVPGYFITQTEAGRIVFPDRKQGEGRPIEETIDTPIVVIVVDELPTASLLNESGLVDPNQYPNLAALVSSSYWFRNATTVSDSTQLALPAIVSGQIPDQHLLPREPDYPDNLFMLLSESHQLNVFETVTDLCSTRFCDTARLDTNERINLLRRGIIGMNVRQAVSNEKRPEQFMAFVESVHEQQPPGLFFHHSLLPHAPWWRLPNGKLYTDDARQPRIKWNDEWLTIHNYQRHLLQVQYLDHLVGELILQLKATGTLDESLVVFVADHGASFQPNVQYRELNAQTAPEILRVPLIIKLPGQQEGVISDRNVQVIDILPTIADALDFEIPWKVDGQSAIDESLPEPDEKLAIVRETGERMVFGREIEGVDEVVKVKTDLFGHGSGSNDLFAFGKYETLVGEHTQHWEIVDNAPFRFELDDESLFAQVDTDSGFVPALIEGSVRLDGARSDSLHFAVSVNGVVRAVGQTFLDLSALRFAVMVPEDSFVEGRNDIEFLYLTGPDEQPELSRIGSN